MKFRALAFRLEQKSILGKYTHRLHTRDHPTPPAVPESLLEPQVLEKGSHGRDQQVVPVKSPTRVRIRMRHYARILEGPLEVIFEIPKRIVEQIPFQLCGRSGQFQSVVRIESTPARVFPSGQAQMPLGIPR